MSALDPSAREVGSTYDRWLTAKDPVALYVRWYLRHREPREYLRLLAELGEPPPARLLDVGCGTGLPLARALARGAGREVAAGVDASERALAGARRRLAGTPQAGEVALELADAAALPFADDTFDAVTCNGVIKYLDDGRLARFLAEARRVLAAGGGVALGDFGPPPDGRGLRGPRVRAVERTHLRSEDELVAALTSAGLGEVRGVPLVPLRRFAYDYVGAIGYVACGPPTS